MVARFSRVRFKSTRMKKDDRRVRRVPMDEPLPDNRFSRDLLPPSGAFQAHPPQPSPLATSADIEARDQSARRSGRETWLTFMLVAVFAGSFVFFLNLVSLGMFFYVIVAVVAIVGVGFLHYVLW